MNTVLLIFGLALIVALTALIIAFTIGALGEDVCMEPKLFSTKTQTKLTALFFMLGVMTGYVFTVVIVKVFVA